MEPTIIRQVNMTAMLVGPNGDVADKVAIGFEHAYMRVVRVGHAAAACERLAVAMPQVVVVLGTLRADERDALSDRATAVGALSDTYTQNTTGILAVKSQSLVDRYKSLQSQIDRVNKGADALQARLERACCRR